jgi:HEPN domain-containing protein
VEVKEVKVVPLIESTGSQSIDAILWIGWADQDYIAARILLLRGLVGQGAAVANTAIEKYLKGLCALSGIQYGGVDHDVCRLSGLLYRHGVALDLNAKFLRFLNKSYKLRYPDDLGPGFNIALNSTATLVEMDFTVDKIRRGFVFQKNGQPVGTKLEGIKKTHSTELLTNNCAITGTTKEQLFAQPSWAYDLRVLDDRTILEGSYAVEKLSDDDNFERSGLTPVSGSDGRSFKFAWLPWQGENA